MLFRSISSMQYTQSFVFDIDSRVGEDRKSERYAFNNAMPESKAAAATYLIGLINSMLSLDTSLEWFLMPSYVYETGGGLQLIFKYTDNITEKDYHKLFDAIPKFQRDNNKWTKKMKISYVENIIKGCKSQPIMLYSIGGNLTDSMILDGLQRTTAIYDFIVGNITVFGDYSYKELCDSKIVNIGVTIPIRVYTFNNEADVVKFYIEMNENITHSAKDIDKARKYLDGIENK